MGLRYMKTLKAVVFLHNKMRLFLCINVRDILQKKCPSK